jgi:hypothetical protein
MAQNIHQSCFQLQGLCSGFVASGPKQRSLLLGAKIDNKFQEKRRKNTRIERVYTLALIKYQLDC